jgi:thermolabile hemolysin
LIASRAFAHSRTDSTRPIRGYAALGVWPLTPYLEISMRKRTPQSNQSRLIRRSRNDQQRAYLFEALEPRQLLAIVPLAPLAADDVYGTSEDQILVGNIISGTTSGGADASAVAGLPLKIIEVDGQSLVTNYSGATTAGATLEVTENGSFTYDASASASLRALATGTSLQDSFTYTVAPDFSQLFVFGDSLSDQGRLFAATNQQFPPDPPYFQGRISNGPVWIEEMASRLDLPMSLVNNFSVAGATTSSANYNESILGTDLPGLADELQQYLAGLNGQPADPNALYVVWAGANDFFLPFSDPAVVIGQAVTNLATTVGTLQAVGAQHILVVNLPDLGLTPYADSIGQAAQLTALSAAFNSALQGALSGPGLRATFIDIFSTFQNVAANPATFGLTNVTDAAINGVAVVGDPADYLFWDSVHPREGKRSGHDRPELAVATIGQRRFGIRSVSAVCLRRELGGWQPNPNGNGKCSGNGNRAFVRQRCSSASFNLCSRSGWRCERNAARSCCLGNASERPHRPDSLREQCPSCCWWSSAGHA